MKTILVPIDFSPISEAVTAEAAILAAALGATVVLLAVVEPPAVMNEYAAMMDIPELIAAGEKNARRQLEDIEERLKGKRISTKSIQVTGGAVPEIVTQAAECKADYIVMGSHGHTAFYDLLVGSTTHGVLNRVTCPVIIVPANKQGPAPRKHRT